MALEITSEILEKDPRNEIMLDNKKEIEQRIEESQLASDDMVCNSKR